MSDPRLKTIRINTGVLKRVCKETQSYQKEVLDIQAKIQKMQAEGEDVWCVGGCVAVTLQARTCTW